jgi:thiol-disulfide isomerase/thioredoxin
VCLICATNAIAQQKTATPSKTTQKPDVDYKQTGAPMPQLKLLLYKDTTTKKDTAHAENKHLSKRKKREEETDKQQDHYLTNDDLDNGANLFVMMFNPTCSHCQDETATIKQNISLFNKTQLVMIATPAMARYLPDFVNMLHVLDYPNMHIGVDSSGFVDKIFLYQMLPQINIYNRDRKLLKTYNGEVAIDSLKKYIE